jgi:lysocardiolipin and lysophospholipid acyltransferase
MSAETKEETKTTIEAPTPWRNNINRQGWVNVVKGVIYLLWMLILAQLGATYILLPMFPLLWISPKIYRRFADYLGAWWFHVTVMMTQFGFGIKFVITGDAIAETDRQAVYISNHRTRLDWLFLWNYFFFGRQTTHEKIILKYPLKSLGPFGWAMQHLRFVFMKRNDPVHDINTLKDNFGAWSDQHYPVHLLLFPEGTDLDTRTLASSFSFAQKQNKPTWKHVLYPRNGAFTSAMTELKEVTSVYDVTMGYPDVIPQSEKLLLVGNLPYEIHIHTKRYPVSAIPSHPEQQKEWLEDVWRQKEEQLAAFYEQNLDLLGRPRSSPSSASSPPFTPILWLQIAICFSSQLFFMLLHAWLRWHYPLFFLYDFLATAFYIVASLRGGLDLFELKVLGRFTPPPPASSSSSSELKKD